MEFKYIAFYKPFGVLCQFTGEIGDRTLADFDLPKDVYPAGRLDKDSEGLLLLTNDGQFNQKITNPRFNKEKTYIVQVEGIPSQEDLVNFREGLKIQNYITKKAKVCIIDINIEPRDPPIRFRKNKPTCWLEVKIKEGKNRQVRRMTAKIGYPTLRLIRTAINSLKLDDLKPGEYKHISKKEIL